MGTFLLNMFCAQRTYRIYFQLRDLPSEIQAMASSKRFSLVACVLASSSQLIYSFLYPGVADFHVAAAFLFALIAFVK